jgi:protoheme IX farnesyltransferase
MHTDGKMKVLQKLRYYFSLIKSLQTLLLVITGLSGYLSSHAQSINWVSMLSIGGSLFLAISGSTVLNMWYDRDIDEKMQRTCWRPLPRHQVSPEEALRLGLLLSLLSLAWAFLENTLYGSIIAAGLLFDVIVYTLWLKRRSAWSIVWGGIAGGMPVLAGRAFGIGQIDLVGILLALAVLFWIPTHILTFAMRYIDDYRQAAIPTIPDEYGFQVTRWIIAISSLAAASAMIAASIAIGINSGYLRLMAVLSTGLLFLAVTSIARPSTKMNFGLFKYASVYMLGSMLMMAMSLYI